MGFIIRAVAIILLLLFTGQQSVAQSVTPPCIGDDEGEPAIYDLQGDFLNGNYPAFYEGIDPFKSIDPSERKAQIEMLEQKIPDGFSKCTLLLSEQRGQSLIQTVTAYETQDGQYLFLLLVLANLNDENKVIIYQFSSNPEEVFGRVM